MSLALPWKQLHVWSNAPTRSTSSLARLLTRCACFVMVRCFCYHMLVGLCAIATEHGVGTHRFRSTLCSAFNLVSFPLGRTSVLGLERGTRLPFALWITGEIVPLSQLKQNKPRHVHHETTKWLHLPQWVGSTLPNFAFAVILKAITNHVIILSTVNLQTNLLILFLTKNQSCWDKLPVCTCRQTLSVSSATQPTALSKAFLPFVLFQWQHAQHVCFSVTLWFKFNFLFLVRTSKCAASAAAVSSVSVTHEWENCMCSLFITCILQTSNNVKHEHAGHFNFATDDSLLVFAHPCIKNFIVLNDKFIQSHCWQVLMINESHKQMRTLQWMCLGGLKNQFWHVIFHFTLPPKQLLGWGPIFFSDMSGVSDTWSFA